MFVVNSGNGSKEVRVLVRVRRFCSDQESLSFLPSDEGFFSAFEAVLYSFCYF